MRRVNVHDLYALGRQLAPLSALNGQSKVNEQLSVLWSARTALLLYMTDDAPWPDAVRRAGRQLIAILNFVVPPTLEEASRAEKELGYYGFKIVQELQTLDAVLARELPALVAYVVSQQAAYRTEDLIGQAEKHIPAELQSRIPSQAVVDLREAGKCLAFRLPTACCFHLWRALEAVIGAYYVSLTSSSFEEDGVSDSWPARLEALRAKNAAPGAMTCLDHIRAQYRNPRTHREDNAEMHEAIAFFGAVASAITCLAGAMQSSANSAR